MNVRTFLNSEEEQKIIAAIKTAELNTSGEIRVHLESRCRKSPLKKGLKVFYKLKMEKTELRNAVLFFVAVKDQKFSILGDEGIDGKVPSNFWDEINSEMLKSFKEEKYSEGLVNGILKAGEQLKSHFPYQSNDVNELSNEISFGD